MHPQHVLANAGKKLRHIKAMKLEDINVDTFKKLIKQAAELEES